MWHSSSPQKPHIDNLPISCLTGLWINDGVWIDNVVLELWTWFVDVVLHLRGGVILDGVLLRTSVMTQSSESSLILISTTPISSSSSSTTLSVLEVMELVLFCAALVVTLMHGVYCLFSWYTCWLSCLDDCVEYYCFFLEIVSSASISSIVPWQISIRSPIILW